MVSKNTNEVIKIDWHDKEEVMRACAIGEMANLLIEAMDWREEYKKYKEDMFEYIGRSKNSTPKHETSNSHKSKGIKP